jgi:hypothetical protein
LRYRFTVAVHGSNPEKARRGLEENEAAHLPAYVNGLAVVGQPWQINELSHVLFLRELYRLGRFGRADGAER